MNIGSLGAPYACYATAYGASKAFVMAFSTCLSAEVNAEGLGEKIEVMAVPVGRVTEAAGDWSPVTLFTPCEFLFRSFLPDVSMGIVAVSKLADRAQARRPWRKRRWRGWAVGERWL